MSTTISVKRSLFLPGVLLACSLAVTAALAGGKPQPGIAPTRTNSSRPPIDEDRLRDAFGKLPISFEENRGQARYGVDYVARGLGYALYLDQGQALLTMQKLDGGPRDLKETPSAAVRMRMLGGRKPGYGTGLDALPGKSNFFTGSRTKRWVTDVPTFKKVEYRGVYPGVDVVYYGNQKQLEYDFIVQPGADPKQIQLKFDGAKKLRIDKNGDLVLSIPGGEMRQNAPFVYQGERDPRNRVPGRYILAGNTVGFEVASYDATKPLVIDPVLRYSTYVGGSSDEYALDIAVDSTGNAFVTGFTGSFTQPQDADAQGFDTSPDIPIVPEEFGFPTVSNWQGDPDEFCFNFDYDLAGGIDTTICDSSYDAFIFKMNTAGNTLLYSTYLGGGGDDYGMAIAIDSAGAAYVTGMTRTTDFPLINPVQALNAGGGDVFIVKLRPAGNSLEYSTYLGGSDLEFGRSIAVDPTGNAFVTGITGSINLPIFRAFQNQFGGGTRDQFVANINSDGSAFNYVSYLGGSGNEGGPASGTLDLDFAHEPRRFQPPGPSTVNNSNPVRTFPAQPIFGPFKTKFNLEAAGQDFGCGIVVDQQGNAYVTGGTNSANFPVFGTNILQNALAGADDAFVTKIRPFTLAAGRATIEFSTYLGAAGTDAGRDITLDAAGNIYVAGFTNSNPFLTVVPAQIYDSFGKLLYDGGRNHGGFDGFVTKLNPAATAIQHSTLLGGTADDCANAVVVNGTGSVYVTGWTQSDDNPFTNNVNQPEASYEGFPIRDQLQGALLGTRDAFIVKLFREDVRPGRDLVPPQPQGFEYSTYLGGGNQDWGMGVSLDPDGVAYVTGIYYAASDGDLNLTDTFPTTVGAYQQRVTFPRANGNISVGFGRNVNVITGQTQEILFSLTEVFLVRLANPPLAPNGLTVTFVSQTQIDLAWSDNSVNETSYEIERKEGSGNFVQIAVEPPDTQTYSDTGLIPSTTYTYRVRAVNPEGASAYSNQAVQTTLPTAPAAPTQLTATALDRFRIRLSWTDRANNEEGFKVERRLGEGAYREIVVVGPVAGVDGTQVFTDGTNLDPNKPDAPLTPNTTYTYRVRSFNVGGDSAFSNEATATTLPNPPSVAPVITSAIAQSDTQIDLTWTDSNPDEDGFKIFRRQAGGISTLVRTLVGSAPGGTYSDTSLQPNTQYFYQVAAFNVSGDGPLSAEVGETTLRQPPTDPSNLSATSVSTTQIDLQWTDNSAGIFEESFFQLERVGPQGTTILQAPGVVGTGVRMFSDTTGSPGTSYTYRVRAVIDNMRAAGRPNLSVSNWSQPVTQTTRPAAPTGVAVQGDTSTSAVVSWTDVNTNLIQTAVERSTDGGGTWTPSGSVGPGVTSVRITGLTPETVVYTFRLIATNSGGNSVPSGTASVRLLAGPTGMNAVGPAPPLGRTQVDLGWTDRSENESGYKIERSTDGVNWVDAGTTAVNAQSGSATGLSPATTYSFRVRAITGNAQSDPSEVRTVTTLPNPPDAPQNLTARALSQTSVELSWTDASDNETRFLIERSTDGGQVFTEIGAVNANTTIFTDSTGLSASQTVRYRVRAENTGGQSGYSNVAEVTTLPLAPGAPSDLRVQLVAASAARLDWTDNSTTEQGFRIERSTDGGTTFSQIATVGMNVVTYTDNGLAADTTYTYRVKAFNAGGESGPAGPVSVITPPAAPSGLTAGNVTNSGLRLFWIDNSSSETGFRIERKTGDGAYAQIGTTGSNETTFQDGGLSGNTTYSYRVRAFNGSGDSPNSNEVTITTLPNPPAAPGGLTAAAVSQNELRLTWTDNSDNEQEFRVERSTDNGNTFTPLATVAANTVSYSDTGLTANTTYLYRVKAVNAGGESAYSNVASGTTTPNPPAAPSGVAVESLSSSQLRVTWRDNSADEGSFEIERRTGSGGFTPVGSVGAEQTSFTDSGLSANTVYSYRVRATNGGGTSAFSETADGITLPSAPSGLNAEVVGSGQVRLSWTDTSGGDGFKIERREGSSAFSPVATTGAGVATYTDQGLAAGKTYTYRVRAFNRGGDSDYSNEATAASIAGLRELRVPARIRGGQRGRGTVVLAGSAPAGGATISLSSSSRSATVPATVTIEEGKNSATFPIRTRRGRGVQNARITATYGGDSRTARVRITGGR